MSMLPVGIGSAEAGGYQIERSLRFNFSDSAHLNRTPASATNRTTWTYSYWFKSMMLKPGVNDYWAFSAFNDGNNYTAIRHHEQYYIDVLSFNAGSAVSNVKTQKIFRDPSAWNHMVIVFDTGNATQSDRVRIYHNGIRADIRSGATYPGSGSPTGWVNSASVHYIGRISTEYFDGYLTEINFIDGQALTPSSFGETDTDTGVWKPKAYSGSYGTNGFYLKFADNSGTTSTTLGKDSSGNGNNWTPNNFSVTAGAGNDSLVDTPTNYGTDTGAGGEVRGNYATLNPLDQAGSLSNGNLEISTTSASWTQARGTLGVSSGKWYWETTLVSGTNYMTGISKSTGGSTYPGANADGWGYASGTLYNNNSGSSYGASYTSGDVIGIALDLDAGTLTFYKNGTSQGQAASGLTGTWFPSVAVYASSGTTKWAFNAGQKPFSYTAPSGFKALCTQNLPEPTIKDGGEYFNTVTYTGNNQTLQSITTVGFQPDLIWIKNRNSSNHVLVDSVRGRGVHLASNLTNAEATDTSTQSVTAFLSNGFSVEADPASYGSVNNATEPYVAWNWKANGAGSTNTAGTITSTVSVNTTSGFSIVTFDIPSSGTSDTIGHGLGVAPSMVILKPRTAGTSWGVYHSGLTSAAYYLTLQTTNAQALSNNWWNSTAPTSSVFTIGSTWYGTTNAVAYCFAPVAGYSAFGSFTGNGSADGPFVYTGFRPRFLMYKNASSAGTVWIIFDSARNTYNFVDAQLRPNESSAENSAGASFSFDFLSNGFKVRSSDSNLNGSGNTMIYAAFAENPFKYSLAR